MADYYCDGTITSASGTGSGTIGDPWGKTDDLWDYCLQQIQAAGGASTNGDQLIVLDGGFNQTYNPDPTIINPVYGQPNMLYVRPYVMDGTQRIPWDLGTYPVMGLSLNRRGYQFWFCDFTNLATTNYSVRTQSFGSVFYCSFDGSAGSHNGICVLGQQGKIIGCRFFNDNRTGGLINSGQGGQQVMWNIFEIGSLSNYAIYTYGSVFAHNLILPTSSYTYNTGIVLPIQTGRMFRNTFYGTTQKGAGFYVPNSYESNYIANNYFEGIHNPINDVGTSQHLNAYEVLAGNRAYNCATSDMPPEDYAVLIYQNNDFTMSESGLVDPANGDYRPNKNLINQGWRDDELNTEIIDNFAELGIKPTIGAYDAVTVAQKVRDLY